MTVPKSKLFADWTVVVADDEQFIRTIVVRMLRDMGCVNILTATSGHEALEHLPAAPAGRTLVLADFSMTGVDGLALTKLIRNAPVGIPRPQVQKRILRYRLADLSPGQVLAQDITTPGGDCLLGAGVTLTERYLRRLGELAAVLNLEHVAVYAPPKVESKA